MRLTAKELKISLQRDCNTAQSYKSIKKGSRYSDQSSRIDVLLLSRTYSLYSKGRKDPRNEYEGRITNREWWRQYITDTPSPGHYDLKDFLQDKNSNPIKKKYNFTNTGREHKFWREGTGGVLQPGMYEHQDLLYVLGKKGASSAFKSSGRTKQIPGYIDKDIKLGPGQYEIMRDPSVKQCTNKPLSSFLSTTSRFPLPDVKQQAPDPGYYNPKWEKSFHTVQSSFKSSSKRLYQQSSKIPGPGTYTSTLGQGRKGVRPASITKMGRQYGIFFRNAVDVDNMKQ